MTEIVRWKVDAIPERPGAMSQRLLDTAPSLSAKAFSQTLRLPAGSRIRRRLITDTLRLGFAAASTHDFETLLQFYDPEVVYDIRDSGIYDLGDMPAVLHGHAGIGWVFRDVAETIDLTYELGEIADAGGSYFAALTNAHMVANFSRIEMTRELSQVYDMRGGLVRRQWTIDGWDKGIEKLGEVASGPLLQPEEGA